jgi:rod shape-determining protein MreC
VILITDPEHAVPVRLERTGLRTIAVGGGDGSSLALPYLPANADIKSGDLLLTSGLGGVFPEGYPVARVSEVHRDAVQPLAQVRAVALSHINSDTELMLVWFRPGHPAAPAAPVSNAADVRNGNAAMQPLAAPPRAAATAAARTEGAPARSAPPAKRPPAPGQAADPAAAPDDGAAGAAPAAAPAAAGESPPPPAERQAEPPRPRQPP